MQVCITDKLTAPGSKCTGPNPSLSAYQLLEDAIPKSHSFSHITAQGLTELGCRGQVNVLGGLQKDQVPGQLQSGEQGHGHKGREMLKRQWKEALLLQNSVPQATGQRETASIPSQL